MQDAAPGNTPDVKKSVLYDKHLERTDKNRMAPFAGYLMPLWYSAISKEHQAVRETAGLFDCTHMGTWLVRGQHALTYLDALTTNNVATLTDGQAQYSYLLDETGHVLDDIIVYRINATEFMVVVNAGNNDKVAQWYKTSQPLLADKVPAMPEILDLKDPAQGDLCKVDMALQGPNSLDILLSLIECDQTKEKLKAMESFTFIDAVVGGIKVVIATTGYTGAKVAYELFPHPDQAAALWDVLLGVDESFGLLPCGLGARDSLRIEAGLPLYGHELAGDHNISPYGAGYGWAVKLKKPFFIGQDAMVKERETYTMGVKRLCVTGKKGVRPLRQDDAILTKDGLAIGWILSSAKAGDSQIILALVDKKAVAVGDTIGLYYTARNERHIQQGKKEKVELNDTLTADIEGEVVERMEKF